MHFHASPHSFGLSRHMADDYHEANRRRWDAGSASWAHRADTRGIWKKCHLDPSLALYPTELRWLSNVASKDVAVLGSGDNQVVFALSGMGAKVTSIDISEPQLEVARNRAAALGLNVTFVRADVVDLSCLGDAKFDLIISIVAPIASRLPRMRYILRPASSSSSNFTGRLQIIFRRCWHQVVGLSTQRNSVIKPLNGKVHQWL